MSILPCLSKILERLIYNRMFYFLQKHNILSNCQYGFRPGRSNELALIDAMEHSIKLLLMKKLPQTSFDQSKAFDIIDHDIVLTKSSNYGFRDVSCNLIRTFLSEGEEITSFMGVTSEVSKVQCRVPQGSILRPLLL